MNTKQFAVILFLFSLSVSPMLASASWSTDDDIVKKYDISNFNKIYLEGGYKVVLEQSDKPGLRIKADEDAFEYVDVQCDAQALKLKITKKHIDLERLVLYIDFVDLEELHIEGGMKLETKGYLDLKDFSLIVEGGAQVSMGVKVDHLQVVGEGGVSFNLKGVAQQFDARISGAGRVGASELKAKSVSFQIEGVGWGSVYATDYLHARINGVGKINYKGSPKVDKQIGGLGYITND